MNSTPDYATLHEQISEQEWWFAASEVHGILSALIALNHSEAWPDMLFADQPPPAAIFFPAFCDELDRTLAANDFNYTLLLPENASCAERAEALVQWTEGFLLAAGYCQRHFAPQLDAEAQGFLDDLAQIATLDTDIGESESHDAELTDLEEHCRLGVMMLYAATRSMAADQAPPQ